MTTIWSAENPITNASRKDRLERERIYWQTRREAARAAGRGRRSIGGPYVTSTYPTRTF